MASLPADIRWPLLADELADPTAPGFPVQEFQAEPDSKYARSTDYCFRRKRATSPREIGVYEHRPLLLTGPADLPPTDNFIGSELCHQGLRWARSPLPGSWAYNEEWGPLFLHQTNPTVELLGGCIWLLKLVNYAAFQAAAHYSAAQPGLGNAVGRVIGSPGLVGVVGVGVGGSGGHEQPQSDRMLSPVELRSLQ